MPNAKPKQPAVYRVANPRGIPPGRFIVRVGERRYFEGDIFEGYPPTRFIIDGFVEEVPIGEI